MAKIGLFPPNFPGFFIHSLGYAEKNWVDLKKISSFLSHSEKSKPALKEKIGRPWERVAYFFSKKLNSAPVLVLPNKHEKNT